MIGLLLGLAYHSSVAAEPDVSSSDRSVGWPQYKRNSERTGNSPLETLTFPLHRISAIQFPAPIYASPAVSHGRAYIQDALGHVACVDSKQNKLHWLTKIDGMKNTSSPALAHHKVYIGSSAGYLAILEMSTGNLLKKVVTDSAVICAPAVTNSAVYFSTMNGKLIKIDFAGNVIWTFDGRAPSYVEIAVKGNEILFSCGNPASSGAANQVLRLLDRGDRVEIVDRWSVLNPTGGPVFGPLGTIGLQSFDSELGAFQVLSSGRQVRSYRSSRRWHTDSRITPSVRDGKYYLGEKIFTPEAKFEWEASVKFLYQGASHSSPALTKEHMVLGTEKGQLLFFDIHDPSKPDEPEWVFLTERAGKSNGAISSSPAVADGRVFFGGEDGIFYTLGQGSRSKINLQMSTALSTSSPQEIGERPNQFEWHTVGGDMTYSLVSPDQHIKPPFRVKWKTRIWGSFKSPMIIAQGRVYCASRVGQVTCLDAEDGHIIWRTSHALPYVDTRSGVTYSEGKLLIMRTWDEAHKVGGLWCHDAATGDVLWHRPVPFGYHLNADGLTTFESRVLVAWNVGQGVIRAAAYGVADGEEIWTKDYTGLLQKGRKKPIRVSSAVGDGRWYLSIPEIMDQFGIYENKLGATVAIDPKNGDLLWKNGDCAIHERTRIGYRNGLVIVFSRLVSHALDAASGEEVWTSPERPAGTRYSRTYFAQPLTDLYLESEGKRGIAPMDVCSYSVFANGVWYGHSKGITSSIVGRTEGGTSNYGFTVNQKVWEYRFNSKACCTPSPAYGRLYYSPNGEGVVYCFEMAD
jgi:outer membrane protein assembly factor BamB